MYNKMMLETKNSLNSDTQYLNQIFSDLVTVEDKSKYSTNKSNTRNHNVTTMLNGLFDDIGSRLLK